MKGASVKRALPLKNSICDNSKDIILGNSGWSKPKTLDLGLELDPNGRDKWPNNFLFYFYFFMLILTLYLSFNYVWFSKNI